MVWDELGRAAQEDNRRDRDKLIGIYIGILAVLLAICGVGGGNAAKDAARANLDATNTWAFFQAKNMRRHTLRLQAEELELRLVGEPSLTDQGKAAIKARIEDYRKQDEILTRDPEKEPARREGLDQLFEKARALEAERDVALRKDPYFDYGQAMIQIAIVLASIALISSGSMLLAASAIVAVLGGLLTFNGFTLMFAVPFLG